MCSSWWLRFLVSALLSLSFAVSTRAIAFEDVTIDEWLKTNNIAPPASDADLPQLFQRYAEKDGWAAYYLAFYYLNGTHVTPDLDKGFSLLAQAASLGNSHAAANLGSFRLQQGATDEAIRWLSRSVQQGNSLGMFWLASMRINSSDPEEVKSAVELYRRADKAGNNAATFALSVLFAQGKVVPQDPVTAFQFAKKAALSTGNTSTDFRRRSMKEGAFAPLAVFYLAKYYDDGFGTSPDPLQAIEWYEKAAALDDQNSQGWYERYGVPGNLVAMSRLGDIYLKGLGVAQDHQKALRWYAAASEKGEVTSTSMLGYMYQKGLGRPKDAKRAVGLLEQTASLIEVLALTEVGILLAEGDEGVPRDSRKAVEYLTKAASKGSIRAVDRLINLKSADPTLPIDFSSQLAPILESHATEKNNGYAAYLLGGAYFKGVVVPKDIEKSEQWLTRAASLEETSILGSFDLGRLLEEKGDLPAALKAYLKAGKGGLASGYTQAGGLFLETRFGQVDLPRAEEYLRLAYKTNPALYENIAWRASQSAFESEKHFSLLLRWLETGGERDHPRALSILGYFKLEGVGGAKDIATGKKLLLRALEKKDGFAAGIIGTYNLRTPGFFEVSTDPVELIKESASSNPPFPLALGDLGRLYLEGSRLPQDVSRGVNLLRVAAEHGDSSAMATLSEEYLKGRILSRDLEQAKLWATLSKKYFFPEADKLIARVEEEIRQERQRQQRKLIDAKYPGWENTVRTKVFGDWLAKQTQETQALADSDKAADAIKLLGAYYENFDEQARQKRQIESERRRQEARERAQHQRAQIGQNLNQGLRKLGNFLIGAAEVGILVGLVIVVGALVAAAGPGVLDVPQHDAAPAAYSRPAPTRFVGNPSYGGGVTSYGEREIEIRPQYNPDPTQRYRGTIDQYGDFRARNPYQYLDTGESATMRGSIDRFGYGHAVDSLGNQYRIRR